MRRWVLLTLAAFLLAACSSNASLAGPTGSTSAGSTGTTGNTGTAAPTSTAPATTTGPTGNTDNPGYFDLSAVKTYTSQVAATYQDNGFSWTYSKSQGDWEANTTGDFCMLSMTNSQQGGETSAQVDNIDMSCGLPLATSSVTRNESDEATALFLGVTTKFARQRQRG